MIISDMSIIIFIIKHTHPSGRNVMLDLCLTVLMGEPGRLCVGDRAGSARLVHFSRQPICSTDVGGDESGVYFSAAAGQPHHIIYYIKLQRPFVCTPFFRHDRQTATKFGTHIRIDMGLILS